jgi:DNA helicase-2/ATP-dependent DNA helicase PcrA
VKPAMGAVGSASDERPYADAPREIVTAMGGRLPTLQQWRAISGPLEPSVIVAGAGSGKTAVTAARVVYLALAALGRIEAGHGGIPPSRVLCLTFTNKAAEELFRRVRDATAPLGLPEGEEPTVLTYHAFAARLLDDYGLRAGIEPGPMLLSEAQRWQVVGSLLADQEFQHLEVRTVGHLVKQVLQLSDECQNHLVEPESVIEESERVTSLREVRGAGDREMLETAQKRIELAGMVAAYRDRKRDLHGIDYGDQIRLACDLARSHPEVGDQFRQRYGAVLLDEYQDTNVAQARLLRDLCGRGYPVTAVGDPDQNIYAWRGASLRNILRFLDDFGADVRSATQGPRPLFVNFRSGSRILAVADEIIEKVPEERRAPDKRLVPDPSRGSGSVKAFVACDERAEATAIARLIREQLEPRPRSADGDLAWGDVAILCRKRRLFSRIAEVLREEGIPAEVVDLGGLLRMPEVVDVIAWLRILDDPARNISLARLLQGPRWRIGYRDLAALARWSADHNKGLVKQLPGEVDRPGDVSFALAEALDHLRDPEMTGLSPEAVERLGEFKEELAVLREAARGALPDLVTEITERSGLVRELEASGSAAAVSARRNLVNLLDHIAAFAPVDGETSLSSLVSYLAVAEEFEDELEPAQPTEANTVKLLTIHKAKGLEWPVVFVPGLAEHTKSQSSFFPDVSRQPNPVTQPRTLPFELRGDADVLPRFGGKLRPFREELKERGLEEERRLCYVAMTRARDVLVLSSAYWYDGPVDPFGPGRFLREVAGDSPEAGAGHPACEVIGWDECPRENPLVELRRSAERWPPPARAADADELFPQGWRRAAEEAVEDPTGLASRAALLGPGPSGEFETALAAHRERAQLIRERARPEGSPALPSTLSVSSLIDYMRCPKLFFWSHVRPLPRRPSRAARLGSEIHRWVELESRGQATLLDVDASPDLSTEERLAEPGAEERLKANFRGSRFARTVPIAAELPFLLFEGGMVVGGRIDAVFGDPDGPWEVVDYKTGRKPPAADPLSGFQLDLYALACVEVWGRRPEDLTLTYFYLASGEEVTRPADPPDRTRRRVLDGLARIRAREFDPTPGDQCKWCDFLSFCPAGRAHVAASPED